MRVEVMVEGLGYSQVNFVQKIPIVVLKEKNGDRLLMISIGGLEAQGIWLSLTKQATPRPLTHDLFSSVFEIGALSLKEVLITDFEQDIFRARLVFDQNGRHVELDCRPSDAIPIALRLDVPILVEEKILNEYGGLLGEPNQAPTDDGGEKVPPEQLRTWDTLLGDVNLG